MAKTPLTTTDKKQVASRAPRSNIAARARFKDPNTLDIPKEVSKHFESEGFRLRWVRMVDPATKQATNERINYFLTIGGDIVAPNDIKKLDPTFLTGLTRYEYREDFADEDDDRGRGAISGIKKGDLLLMKLPVDYLDEKQEMNLEMVEEQLTSAQHEYKRNGGEDVFVEKFKHGRARVQVKEGFFE